MFLRRDVLQQLGGFDPRFFMYCEDWEFSARIADSKWGMRYVPDAVIFHEGHASIRGGTTSYVSPLAVENPSRGFYLTHVIAGNLLSLEACARPVERIIGSAFLLFRWSKWASLFAVRGEWDGIAAMARGISLYLNMRNGQIAEPGLDTCEIMLCDSFKTTDPSA